VWWLGGGAVPVRLRLAGARIWGEVELQHARHLPWRARAHMLGLGPPGGISRG
jgi:hypothetical protein